MWKAPANAPSQPLINLNLDDAGLVGRSKLGGLSDGPAVVSVNVSGANIRTQPAVPEPSAVFLLCSTGLFFLNRRSRS